MSTSRAERGWLPLVPVVALGLVLATAWWSGATSPAPSPPVNVPSGHPGGGSGPLALHEAARDGDAGFVSRLVAAGYPADGRDAEGATPLLLAVRGDHVAAARALLEAGADPDALDGRHDTPWLATGEVGDVELGRLLFAAGPDLTIRNRFGGVAVIPAAERGHVEYVRWVVTTGIDVNHVNDLGWTALLEAVILGDGGPRHQEIVRILLAAGARPDLADRNGVTALGHARERGQADIVGILEAAAET